MPLPVGPIGGIAAPAVPELTRPAAGNPGEFRKFLSSAIREVELARTEADTRTQRFLSGENEELHQVVLATQHAEISLELFQQVRNKVVQAYQEVMRMQM